MTAWNLVLIVCLLTSGYLYADDCPALPPCTCGSSTTIYCSSLGLTEFPRFKTMDGIWALNIFNNSLTNIPSRAVHNIKLQMFLAFDNDIESVADDAFEGQEDILLVVHLYNNRLRHLPQALGSLNKLMGLYIYNNPMSTLDARILSDLSDSLSGIAIGSPEMTSLPSLKNMTSLFSLDLYSLPVRNLPEDLFQGFEENMEFFSIQSSAVVSIPKSIGRLRKLQYLSLVGNKMLTSDGLPVGAFQGLSKLNDITIVDCAIESLPPIFHFLKTLYMMSVLSVPITILSSDTFNHSSENLWYIKFNDTRLSEISNAFSSVRKLRSLEITFSKITELGPGDLANTSALQTLYLSNNPINNISPDAFSMLDSLQNLYLDSTLLTSVPQAIKNLRNLSSINLMDTRIVCNCDSLGWIKHWNEKPPNLQIVGNCFDNKNISFMEYIYKEVPKCP